MNRDDAKVFTRACLIALFVVLASAAFADTPKLPAGITCEFVRSKVAEYGKVYAYAWARMQGYTSREVAEAKRCLAR